MTQAGGILARLRPRWPYAVALVALLTFVVLHQLQARRDSLRELEEIRQVFIPQLWNLEDDRAAETGEIILQWDSYESLRIYDNTGQLFVDVHRRRDLSGLDRALRAVGLIWTVETSLPMLRGGENIGTLSVVREDRSVVLYAAAGAFLALCAFLFQLRRRNVEQQRELAETLLHLEKSRRKEVELRLGTREAQLQEVRRLESLGRLAGGLAHDFNNVLTVIQCSAEMLLDRDDLPPAARELARAVEDASARAGRMTKQLLEFSRRRAAESEVLSLNDVVSDMRSMLARLIGHQIELDARLDASLRKVRANRAELEQVIMNLVLNSRDAIEGQGTVTLETANVEDGTGPPRVGLVVTDTGKGMDAETASRAFEAFFSTKGAKGTGLGLSTVEELVRTTGGVIQLESEPGRGTRVEILFPCAEGEAPASPEASQDRVRARVAGNRVLVIEDQEMIRKVVKEGLQHHGFVVEEAADGSRGIEALMSAVPPFDLVITDLNLPGKSGADVCRAVRSHRPETRVVCMSGHASADLSDPALSPYPFLPKPFTVGQLMQRVREALQRPAEADGADAPAKSACGGGD